MQSGESGEPLARHFSCALSHRKGLQPRGCSADRYEWTARTADSTVRAKAEAAVQHRFDERGFTLIELMMVILIIGVLVTLAVPVFRRMQADAQRKTCAANVRTMNGAIQSYAAEHDGTYPAAVGDLAPDYVRVIPACPSGGNYSLVGAAPDLTADCDYVGPPAHDL